MKKSDGIKKRMANLKPFKPGQSGNPLGRSAKPKQLPALKTLLNEVFGSTDEFGNNSRMMKILVAISNKAQRGNVQAAKLVLELWEFVEPKLSRQTIDLTSKGESLAPKMSPSQFREFVEKTRAEMRKNLAQDLTNGSHIQN
ncbi:MAG TPA: DUF5681 domain-containing protein [Chitinophagaceae bacterium]|jgi:hypothetical protein|nr:DUF5681 domain-containing protein [Chitinophagaceae bacterium]